METVVVLASDRSCGEVFLVPTKIQVAEVINSLPGNVVRGFSSPVGVQSVFPGVKFYWTSAALKLRDSELAAMRERRNTRNFLLDKFCQK